MTIRIDTLQTEVSAEAPQGGPQHAAQSTEWQEAEKVSAARARQLRDSLRTHAAGSDD
ncbi:MAG TPA: hypothetical protein VF665_05685 [Longimicrobium sp.]|jgi:hypothetical protein|uniref:hypothetical protein n=1 Tax=Longimicrobium sp. TaxID=2029185 RepID=UPI002EDBABEA